MFPKLSPMSPLSSLSRGTSNALISRVMSVLCKVELGDELQFRPHPAVSHSELADDVVDTLRITFSSIVQPNAENKFLQSQNNEPNTSAAHQNIHVRPAKWNMICQYTSFLFSTQSFVQNLIQLCEKWVNKGIPGRTRQTDVEVCTDFFALLQAGLHEFSSVNKITLADLRTIFKGSAAVQQPANPNSPIHRLIAGSQYSSDSEGSTSSGVGSSPSLMENKSYILQLLELSESQPNLAQHLSQNPAILNSLIAQGKLASLYPNQSTIQPQYNSATIHQQMFQQNHNLSPTHGMSQQQRSPHSPSAGFTLHQANQWQQQAVPNLIPMAVQNNPWSTQAMVYPKSQGIEKSTSIPKDNTHESSKFAQQQLRALDSAVLDAANSLATLTGMPTSQR